MAKRPILRRWLRQPPGWVGIDWGHSRTVGLEFFAPLSAGHDLRELVSGARATRTGLEAYNANQAGAHHLLFGASNYADFPAKPAGIGTTTPFTVAWTQEPRSTAGYSTVLEFQFGTVGADVTFVVYLAASDSTYYFTAGPRSTAQAWSAAVGAVTNDRLDRFVLRSTGGPNSTTTANWSLYRNGSLITIGSTVALSGNTAAQYRIGARDAGSDPFEGLIGDVRMWSRVLSDDEAEAESTISGALELWAPKRIWVPAGAANTSHATSGALAAQAATLSGAALHPHTTTGALSAQDATVSGAAVHPHTTTGALSAQAATVAGAATHPHTTTGALSAAEASVSGAAEHTSPATHDATGALSASAATIDGSAAHVTLHDATGDLAASAASLVAVAQNGTASTLRGRVRRRIKRPMPGLEEDKAQDDTPAEEKRPAMPSLLTDPNQILVQSGQAAEKVRKVYRTKRRLAIEAADDAAIDAAVMEFF